MCTYCSLVAPKVNRMVAPCLHVILYCPIHSEWRHFLHQSFAIMEVSRKKSILFFNATNFS